MMDWWTSREPRERALLATAGVLTALVLAYFGFWRPLAQAHKSADQALISARADASIVQRGIETLGAGSQQSSGPAPDVDAFRARLARSAREAGLSIARVQNGADGTIQIRLDDTDPPRLFAWLTTMEDEPGGNILAATLNTRNDERIEAVIELRGGRP